MSALTRKLKISNARYILFLVLFFIYNVPILRSFARSWEQQGHVVRYLPLNGLHWESLMWIVFTVVLYALLRGIASQLRLKMHLKTAAMHKNDLLHLVYFTSALAVLGRVVNRIDARQIEPLTGLSFIPLVGLYTFFYTLLFEVLRPVDMSLSRALLGNVAALATFALASCVVLGVLVGNIFDACMQTDDFRDAYFFWLLIGAAFHTTFFLASRLPWVSGHSHLRLHHWYWPLPLAHLAVFDSDLSMVSQAMFIGIFIHGVACFGVEPLCYSTELMARMPHLFELQLKDDGAISKETISNRISKRMD